MRRRSEGRGAKYIATICCHNCWHYLRGRKPCSGRSHGEEQHDAAGHTPRLVGRLTRVEQALCTLCHTSSLCPYRIFLSAGSHGSANESGAARLLTDNSRNLSLGRVCSGVGDHSCCR